MPTHISCPCLHCANLPDLLRRNTAKNVARHLKTYGPAPLPLPLPAPVQPQPQQDHIEHHEELDQHHAVHDAAEMDPLADPGPAAVPGNQPRAPRQPPADTIWVPATLPNGGPDAVGDVLPEDAAPILPPAYVDNEPSSVRMAYLQAVFNNVCNNVPVRQTNDNLLNCIRIIESTGTLPDWPVPVTTLASAKRRLGIDPDQWIIQYAVCPRCWKHFTPLQMEELQEPLCPMPHCQGTIFETYKNASNELKQRAIKVIPQVSLLQSIRRMVHRKGFRKLIRDSRNTPRNQNDNPDFVMKDMHDAKIWHDLRTHLRRETGNHGTVRDVSAEGDEGQRLTDHRFGLHMIVNLDWFGALENRPHSSGPIYVSFADLPREERYLQINTICIAITPGPLEPTTEQLNHCMEPFVRDVIKLQDGVAMDMYEDDDVTVVEEEVYGGFNNNNCDTPAGRKISGFAGHSHDLHPCPWCECVMNDINRPQGYSINQFLLRDDFDLLKQKFYSRDAAIPRQSSILNTYGVRWSAFDWLPGWRPAMQTPLDFMHCIFLGVVAFLFTRILYAGHLFSNLGGTLSTNMQYEAAINSIQWPSHITRLPKNLGKAKGLSKADEWRRLLTVAPVVLWCAWKDGEDEIPDTEPPVAPNENITTTHCRKRRTLYDVVLLLCAAVRILSNKTISMAQAVAGQTYLANYCQRMLELGVVLTINHHLAMHFAAMIKLFGPVYAWWLFAFERFNGHLEKVKTNGHDGGRLELTMMRNWVQTHLIYELLLQLPADASEYERQLIDRIIRADAARGGMAVEIAIYRSEATVDCVSLPKRVGINAFNIHMVEGLYTLLFNYARNRWPALGLQREFSDTEGVPFIGDRVARRLPYIRKDGLRYGCKSNNRSSADVFAFIKINGQRVPIQIEDLFLLKIPNTNAPAHACARIRRLHSDDQIPDMPWQI